MLKFFLSAGVVGAVLLPWDAAWASPCASGQIYRPSRGICVSRAQAVEAGIFGRSSHRHMARAVDSAPRSPESEVANKPARSVIVASSSSDALAYDGAAPVRKPAAFRIRLDSPPRATPSAAVPKGSSPYGGLVALEPSP